MKNKDKRFLTTPKDPARMTSDERRAHFLAERERREAVAQKILSKPAKR